MRRADRGHGGEHFEVVGDVPRAWADPAQNHLAVVGTDPVASRCPRGGGGPDGGTPGLRGTVIHGSPRYGLLAAFGYPKPAECSGLKAENVAA